MEAETPITPATAQRCRVCEFPLTSAGGHDLRAYGKPGDMRYDVAKGEVIALHEQAAGPQTAQYIDGLDVTIESLTEFEANADGSPKLDRQGQPIPKVLRRGKVVGLDTVTGRIKVKYDDGSESET